jgi:endogenous inhibitor of DNA gyrase (YacG/DUF329 family)
LIDLGDWADEKFKVPTQNLDQESIKDADPSDEDLSED